MEFIYYLYDEANHRFHPRAFLDPQMAKTEKESLPGYDLFNMLKPTPHTLRRNKLCFLRVRGLTKVNGVEMDFTYDDHTLRVVARNRDVSVPLSIKSRVLPEISAKLGKEYGLTKGRDGTKSYPPVYFSDGGFALEEVELVEDTKGENR